MMDRSRSPRRRCGVNGRSRPASPSLCVAQAGVGRGQQYERGPVKAAPSAAAIATRRSDDARGRHRHGFMFRFHQGERGSLVANGAAIPAGLDDLAVVGVVDAGIERSARSIPPFRNSAQNLAHAFERGRDERVGAEFHQLRKSRVFTDHEQTLAEALRQDEPSPARAADLRQAGTGSARGRNPRSASNWPTSGASATRTQSGTRTSPYSSKTSTARRFRS